MSFNTILYDVEDQVLTITLNRPEILNAFNGEMLADLCKAFDMADADDEVRAIIITGAGRGFCSGVDMNALSVMSEAGKRVGASHEHLAANPGNPDDDPNYKSSPTYFLGLRKPLIAAVNGACAGLGFSYATFCDMRFMDSGAKIISSFAPRGLIGEHGTSWMLPRIVGPSNALDIYWSSRRIEAVFPYSRSTEATSANATGLRRRCWMRCISLTAIWSQFKPPPTVSSLMSRRFFPESDTRGFVKIGILWTKRLQRTRR